MIKGRAECVIVLAGLALCSVCNGAGGATTSRNGRGVRISAVTADRASIQRSSSRRGITVQVAVSPLVSQVSRNPAGAKVTVGPAAIDFAPLLLSKAGFWTFYTE